MFSIACGIAILSGLKYRNTWKQYFFDVEYTLNREDAVQLRKHFFSFFCSIA